MMAHLGRRQSLEKPHQNDPFNTLLQEIHRTENEAKKLLKDMKNMLDAVMGLHKCESKIVSDLKKSPLCAGGKSSDAQLRNTVDWWSSSLAHLNDHCKKFTSDCSATCIDPLKDYLHLVSAHHGALRRREKALEEHARALARWKKVEKEGKFSVTTAKLSQLRNHLTETEIALDALNAAVTKDLTVLSTKSFDFFQPLLTSLAEAQRTQYKSSYGTLNALSATTNRQTAITERSLQDELTVLRSQLDALSIVDKP